MDGFLANRLSYFHRIWMLRYFWVYLVKIDLHNRYKRSFLGIAWSLLRPLAMTGIFCLVFGKLFNFAVEDYAPYLLIGLTTWQFLTESLQNGCSSLTLGSTFFRQQQVPLAIFPLRVVLGSGFHALMALAMALTITLFLRGFPEPLALLYLLPAMLLILALAWVFAILSAIMQTHFPDTKPVLEIGLQILLYVTPIIYRLETIESRTRLTLLVECNPLTSILALMRTPILEGTPPAMQHIVISLLMLVVLGGLAFTLLHKLERRLIFWI